MSIKPKHGSRKKHQTRSIRGTYSSKLTDKQKAFADRRLNHPKESRTESAYQTYNTLDRNTAGTIANDNVHNPAILLYMEAHQGRAQENIVDLADNATSENVKLSANQDIINRTAGMPTKKIELQQRSVNINLTFSNESIDQ